MQRPSHLLFLLGVMQLEIEPVLIGDAFVLLHEVSSGKEIQNSLLLALLCVSLETIKDIAPGLVGWLK